MALAARSSAEPRTACPVCGGPIHPIAGKCKHCKTDLVKLRRQQAAAAAASAPSAGPRSPYAGGHAAAPRAPTAPVVGSGPVPINGAAHAAPAPVIIAAPVAATDPYVVSLPPVRRGAWSRSWPIVVAVIAAAAIVVSVILLLTGGGKDHRDSRQDRVVPPPAPDRMNTDPLPSDPWQGASPGSGSGNTYPSVPSAPSPPPPSAPVPPTPVPPTGASAAPAPEKFKSAMFQAVCARFKSCGTLGGDAQQICDQIASAASAFDDTSVKDQIARGECTYDRDKATSCMSTLESLPCSQGQADLNVLATALGITDCASALECH